MGADFMGNLGTLPHYPLGQRDFSGPTTPPHHDDVHRLLVGDSHAAVELRLAAALAQELVHLKIFLAHIQKAIRACSA